MSNSFSALILEDDAGFASLVCRVVSGLGGQGVVCSSLAQASAALRERVFDLLLLDNHLPDGKAYGLFESINRVRPDTLAIMITGAPDLAEAVALTRNGLFDYLTKPLTPEALEGALRGALLKLGVRGRGQNSPLSLGESPAMREVMQQLRQAARHLSAVVLLTGESGVGKDLAARTLHRLTFGERAEEAAYVPVNCASLPGEMFEAELFGAERGAYTGADRRRGGLAGAARNGTLFLDEIGEVPLALQGKLLRFLEGREFRALGSAESQHFAGRLVAATNKDLRQEAAAGRFREDLLFRIEVHTICLPPLRQRREDIPRLAEELLAALADRYGRQGLFIQEQDLKRLKNHDFPGNVRELRNIIERSILRTPDDCRWLRLDGAWIDAGAGSALAKPSKASKEASPAAAIAAPAPGPIQTLPPARADLTPLEAQEYLLIRSTLAECRGGIRRAAVKLGLSPQALLRRLEKWPELRLSETVEPGDAV